MPDAAASVTIQQKAYIHAGWGHVFWAGGVHARDLACSFIPTLLHFWFIRTNFARVCVSILTSVENDPPPPQIHLSRDLLERRQFVILHPQLIFLIEISSIGGFFKFFFIAI